MSSSNAIVAREAAATTRNGVIAREAAPRKGVMVAREADKRAAIAAAHKETHSGIVMSKAAENAHKDGMHKIQGGMHKQFVGVIGTCISTKLSPTDAFNAVHDYKEKTVEAAQLAVRLAADRALNSALQAKAKAIKAEYGDVSSFKQIRSRD